MEDRPAGRMIEEMVPRVRAALGADLKSVVVFGSAAEDRLRPTSDVNVLFVLTAFDPVKMAAARGVLAAAAAAIRLDPMFILESEIAAAAEAFPVKFADIVRRHRVVFGSDPFSVLTIDRQAQRRRLDQVLLNLILRLRRALAIRSDAELSSIIAHAAAALRAAAGSFRDLAGKPPIAPHAALDAFVDESGTPGSANLATRISEAREGNLAEGLALETIVGVITVAESMRSSAAALVQEHRR